MGRPYSIQDIKDFFHKGDTRSVQLKKSIVSCLFIKVISVIISLLMVPMCIHYINAEQYGIWLTLSTMVFWLGFFDIGLSNGLRNKFAEAKAERRFHPCPGICEYDIFYAYSHFCCYLAFFCNR